MAEPSEFGQWKRISILGSGAFGVVSLWQNTATEEYTAVKRCKFQSEGYLNSRQKTRWENEVSIIKTLDCPFIIQFKALPGDLAEFLDMYNPSKLPLLSMEYCEKGNMRHVLNQTRNSSGLPEDQVKVALSDIAHGLMYLHLYDITHRDLKPENIVLANCFDRPTGVIYKIIDLGYAKELNDSTVSFVGTLHYLAPEIMMGKHYNFTVDYWSFGVVVFEIICGVLPFLPQYTPMERFNYIKDKDYDIICIYHLQSGGIASSHQLPKETHLSEVLKLDIEHWLVRALQFEPSSRYVSKTTNIMQELIDVVATKTITVFAVFSLTFLSYKTSSNTFGSTLMQWITRDTETSPTDLILLTDTGEEIGVDKTFEATDCVLFYLFKRGVFCEKRIFTLPKYVRTLFENSQAVYNWRELRALYVKSLFFLTQEEKSMDALLTAFHLINSHVKKLLLRLQNVLLSVRKILTNIVGKVDGYYAVHSNNFNAVEVENDVEYKKCLEKFHGYMSVLKKLIIGANYQMKNFEGAVEQLRRSEAIVAGLVNYSPRRHTDAAAELLSRGGSSSSMEMVRTVSSALKEKDKLFINQEFQSYVNTLSNTVIDLRKTLDEVVLTHASVKDIGPLIESHENQMYQIITTSVQRRQALPMDGGYANLSTDALITENVDLRARFEELLVEMTATHTRFQKDLDNLM